MTLVVTDTNFTTVI